MSQDDDENQRRYGSGGRGDRGDRRNRPRVDIDVHVFDDDSQGGSKFSQLIEEVRKMHDALDRLTAVVGQADIPKQLADKLAASSTALDKAVADNTPPTP